jgi:hypothetical protein
VSVDVYFGRQYDRKNYNCLHFVSDVWLESTGVDIRDKLANLFNPNRVPSKENFKAFKRLDKPESPCIVLMSRRFSDPHVGVYIRGRVLHICELGVEFQPIEIVTFGFHTVRFYSC